MKNNEKYNYLNKSYYLVSLCIGLMSMASTLKSSPLLNWYMEKNLMFLSIVMEDLVLLMQYRPYIRDMVDCSVSNKILRAKIRSDDFFLILGLLHRFSTFQSFLHLGKKFFLMKVFDILNISKHLHHPDIK